MFARVLQSSAEALHTGVRVALLRVHTWLLDRERRRTILAGGGHGAEGLTTSISPTPARPFLEDRNSCGETVRDRGVSL